MEEVDSWLAAAGLAVQPNSEEAIPHQQEVPRAAAPSRQRQAAVAQPVQQSAPSGSRRKYAGVGFLPAAQVSAGAPVLAVSGDDPLLKALQKGKRRREGDEASAIARGATATDGRAAKKRAFKPGALIAGPDTDIAADFDDDEPGCVLRGCSATGRATRLTGADVNRRLSRCLRRQTSARLRELLLPHLRAFDSYNTP
jgi:hypothetical protein